MQVKLFLTFVMIKIQCGVHFISCALSSDLSVQVYVCLLFTSFNNHRCHLWVTLILSCLWEGCKSPSSIVKALFWLSLHSLRRLSLLLPLSCRLGVTVTWMLTLKRWRGTAGWHGGGTHFVSRTSPLVRVLSLVSLSVNKEKTTNSF